MKKPLIIAHAILIKGSVFPALRTTAYYPAEQTITKVSEANGTTGLADGTPP